MIQIDLNHFNPDTVEPLIHDTEKQTLFLSVLESTTSAPEIEHLLSLFLATFNSESDAALILFLRNGCTVQENLILCFMNESSQRNSAEILLLYEDIIPDSDFFARLLASTHCLLEFSQQHKTSLVYQAMAMNLQVLLSDSPQNRETYSQFHLDYIAQESETGLLQQILAKDLPIQHPRSEIIYRISEAALHGPNPWLDKNIEAAIDFLPSVKVTSIVFWGRSGSTFLQSLLDNHPQLLSIGPSFFSTVTEYPKIWDIIINLKPQSLYEVIEIFSHMFDIDHPYSISKEFYLFSQEKSKLKHLFMIFCHKIVNKITISRQNYILQAETRKQFFIIIHYAYALALGQDIRKKQQIIHQLHLAEDTYTLSQMLQDFPDLRIIGMTRHPIKGLYSQLNHTVLEQKKIDPNLDYPDIVYSGYYINRYRHILMGWRRAELMLNKPIYGIWLEHLHEAPEQTLRQLTSWLGIEWHPRLLESTQDGIPFEIPSGVHEKIFKTSQVFDPERVNYNHWKSKINEIEAFTLEGLLQKDLNNSGIVHIPNFQHNLSYLLLFVPTQIEWQALMKALQPAHSEHLKFTVLSILERYFFTWLYLCGYYFYVDPGMRIIPAPKPTPES
jgi:hypothetical protein